MEPTEPKTPPNTKYADFITQAQEGIAQAIKAKTGKAGEEPPLVKLLRKLLEDDDDDTDTPTD